MVPGDYNFKNRYAGDTSSACAFQVFDVNEDGDENPVDLTGVEILMQLKIKEDLDFVKSFSIGDNIVLSDAENGMFVLNSFNVDFDSGKYKYDIQITFPNGDVKTYLRGFFKVINDVSR